MSSFIIMIAMILVLYQSLKLLLSKYTDGKPIIYIFFSIVFTLAFLILFQYKPIPEGIYKVDTSVETGSKTYDAFVDIEIIEEGDDDGRWIYYYPKTIYWANGNYTFLEYDEAGKVGDKLTVYSKSDGKEFEIVIPKIEFSLADKLKAVSLYDWIMYVITWSVGFISIAIHFAKWSISIKESADGQ